MAADITTGARLQLIHAAEFARLVESLNARGIQQRFRFESTGLQRSQNRVAFTLTEHTKVKGLRSTDEDILMSAPHPDRIEAPITAQFVQDGVCQQLASSAELAELKRKPVVLWVKLPGSVRACGHFGYLVQGLFRGGAFKPTNGDRLTYVCEHMGHLIE